MNDRFATRSQEEIFSDFAVGHHTIQLIDDLTNDNDIKQKCDHSLSALTKYRNRLRI
jgi:hypothetical protein